MATVLLIRSGIIPCLRNFASAWGQRRISSRSQTDSGRRLGTCGFYTIWLGANFQLCRLTDYKDNFITNVNFYTQFDHCLRLHQRICLSRWKYLIGNRIIKSPPRPIKVYPNDSCARQAKAAQAK